MSKEPLLNSDKEVPKTKSALLDKYQKEESKRLDPESIQSVIDELPTPSGYRLLVLPFTPKEKTKGGIIYS